MALKIEMGIGWKPDPEKPGGLVSCMDGDYVAEINRLRSALDSIGAMVFLDRNGTIEFKPDCSPWGMLNAVNTALEE